MTAAVAERAGGDHEIRPAQADQRAGAGIGRGGGGVPSLGLGAAEAVGEQGQAAVAGPAPLAAFLGLGG